MFPNAKMKLGRALMLYSLPIGVPLGIYFFVKGIRVMDKAE